MDFDFTPDQQLLRNACREVLERESPLERVREVAASGEGYDRGLWKRTAELGWCGLTVPEALGGAGFGLVEALVLAEEHGRLAQPGPLLSTTVVALALDACASDAQRDAWLPRIAAGECIATWAALDDGGSADPLAAMLAAESEGDGWRLHGRKRLVVDAPVANLLLVSARTAEGPALFLVEADAAGVRTDAHRTLDLSRSMGLVTFDSVRLAREARLPDEDIEIGRASCRERV